MIQIVLLLFGVEFVQTKAKYLMLVGILWGVLGVSIFIDGLDGVTYFHYAYSAHYCLSKV